MSDFDPVERLQNLATRATNLAAQIKVHGFARPESLHLVLQTAEHCLSAGELDINHHDPAASMGHMAQAEDSALAAHTALEVGK